MGLCLDVSDRHAPRGFTAPWKAAACLADGQLPEGAAFGCCAGTASRKPSVRLCRTATQLLLFGTADDQLW